MAAENESKLEAEWRSEVMRRIGSIEANTNNMSQSLAKFDHAKIESHDQRIRDLELKWAKAIGIVIGVQILSGVLWALVVWGYGEISRRDTMDARRPYGTEAPR